METEVTGRLESASKATGLGERPAETMSEPRAATIAPLSVHSPGLRDPEFDPCLVAPFLSHGAKS
jgi:hypothetical protein